MFIKIGADELPWWSRAAMRVFWYAHHLFIALTRWSVKQHLRFARMQRETFNATEVDVQVRLMIPKDHISPIVEARKLYERKQLVPVNDPRAMKSRN